MIQYVWSIVRFLCFVEWREIFWIVCVARVILSPLKGMPVMCCLLYNVKRVQEENDNSLFITLVYIL